MQTPESLSQRCRVRITGVGLGAPAFLTTIPGDSIITHPSDRIQLFNVPSGCN